MADVKKQYTKQVDVEARREKDDALLAAAMRELDVAEKKLGKPVSVHVNTSNAAGNCMDGVIEWRKKWAGGREDIPARELLTIATSCRDRVPQVVLGVRKAIGQALEGKV